MAITKKGKGWKLKFEKPKKMKELDLFDIEVINKNGTFAVIRDCTYDSVTNEFTQVDNKNLKYHRLDTNLYYWRQQ